MPSRGTKIGIAVAVLAILGLGAAGAANADDDVDDDDDDDVPPPPPPPPEDPPQIDLPPKGNLCNYSGCGPLFDNAHDSPTSYCIRVQQLGYPIDCALVASNGSYIAVNPQRSWIAKLQSDNNKVRMSAGGLAAVVQLRGPQAIAALQAIKAAGPVMVDGLMGAQSILMLGRVLQLQLATGIPWRNLVALA